VRIGARLVIVGDTLLDRDVTGEVTRLCPDAPAPVLDERRAVERPGGAGLAALLARRHGLDVTLVTALADDPGGIRMAGLLRAAGVRVLALALAGSTPEKIRLRSGDRTLLRLDRGGGGAVADGPPEAALSALDAAAVVLVSDYGRGVPRRPALREALAGTRVPVVWDPHPHGPAPVANVRLATPNESEVRELTPGGGDRLAVAARGAAELRRRWRAAAVAVTMADHGALLCHAGPAPLVVPVPARVDGDGCGAGDSFAVAAAAAIADGAPVAEAVRSAVAAASSYVAAGGVRTLGGGPAEPVGVPVRAVGAPVGAPVRAVGAPVGDGMGAAAGVVARVRARGGRIVATGGCFDLLHAGHVATLQAARGLGDCLVVCLNSDAGVARLKGGDRPVNPQADRYRVLAALGCVDAVVVFDEPTPHAVLSRLRPDVWVKGGDYGGGERELPEAELVRRWDGQAVLVPYLPGRSTTALVSAANGGRRG